MRVKAIDGTRNASVDKHSLLKQYFGHGAFRQGQEALVDVLLSGRDVLGVMPTGAGKSLCYQLPALLLPGVTLVISPLISLMKDQVSALSQAGIPAAFVNSSLSAAQCREVLRRAGQGAYKIIYAAPERLASAEFLVFAEEAGVSLIAVDEAHCVSQWGQDFRPSYLKIAGFVNSLPVRPAVGAFTATATAQVKDDIAKLLCLREPLCMTTGFDRPNLYFEVAAPRHKAAYLHAYIAERSGQSGIVYCATRKSVETICAELLGRGVRATRYHAGLTPEERKGNQEDFIYDRAEVMVATNAFGMGIDKSNVGFVVHYNMPKNLESYYQEAGRAGRDGEPARCTLLFSSGDVQTAKYLIRSAEENEELSEADRALILRQDLERLGKMTGYCKTGGCLRAYILEYFGEGHTRECGNCGNCGGEFTPVEITVPAQKILSAVARTQKRYASGLGLTLVVRMLHGSRDQRVLQLGLDRLPTYGIMRDTDRRKIREYIEFLIDEGYLKLTDGEYPVLRLAKSAEEVLFRGKPVIRRERIDRTEPERKAPLPGHATMSGPDGGLFAALRELRAQLAQEENVPAYIVFSNAALMDMAARKPANKSEFLQVSGVGEVKAARYGRQFLSAIEKWLAEDARKEQ